ncbi:hypothetical protein [Microbacterium flavescens]|uniref:hypothetical protein n=1 Tax=Microbacterium flavescens TaxID=69366 RepID=UPI001BDED688|nr:hypothetical protein [Microbacterium flavescens]BFF12270.1 hypothetical protein GCM10025699_35730 [Microbacterium flavescens]
MAASSSVSAEGIRDHLQNPVLWYCFYLVLVGAAVLAVTLSPSPNLPSQDLVSFAGVLATAPPVALVVWIASRMPVTTEGSSSALAGTGRWAGRLIWTGATFALGAYIATLLAFDLDRVGTASSANQYFYGFLALIVVSVALIALAGVVAKSAWLCFSVDHAGFARAAVRALTSERWRDALPLRDRIWLDDADGEPMPRFAAIPRTGRLVRVMTPAPARGSIFVAAFLFLVALSSLYPTIVGWIS